MGQRIVIINRWSDDFASYEKSIDHQENQVCYIVNANGRQGIRADQSLVEDILEIEHTNDLDALRWAGSEIQKRHGNIDRILALSEFDLKEAAELRTILGVEGIQADQVLLYKDKVEMKKRIGQRGLRAPQFVDEPDVASLLHFAEQVGYPIIVKPKTGAASHGVHLVEHRQALQQLLPTLPLDQYECEEYVQGPICHIDGLIRQGEFVYIKPAQYINTCLEFNHGIPLGSFMIDEPQLKQLLIDFTRQTLEALELVNGAFHLEVILKDGREPVFLEIGARVGGGEIPFLAKALYGIDLMDEWIKIELGISDKLAWRNEELYGGFLMVPEPQITPCKVVAAPSMMGMIPSLLHEMLPKRDDILDGQGGYEKIGGRFLYRGETSEQLRRDILKTIETYRLAVTPLVPNG